MRRTLMYTLVLLLTLSAVGAGTLYKIDYQAKTTLTPLTKGTLEYVYQDVTTNLYDIKTTKQDNTLTIQGLQTLSGIERIGFSANTDPDVLIVSMLAHIHTGPFINATITYDTPSTGVQVMRCASMYIDTASCRLWEPTSITPVPTFPLRTTITIHEPGTYALATIHETPAVTNTVVIAMPPSALERELPKSGFYEINGHAKTTLQQKFSVTVSESYTDIKSGKSWISAQKGKNSVTLREVPNVDTISKLAFSQEAGITTDAVTVEGTTVKNATIRLAKTGPVSAIARCDVTVGTTCISGWTQTNIPFTDYGDSIEFTVEHFTSYGGIAQTDKYYLSTTHNGATASSTANLTATQDGTINWVNITSIANGAGNSTFVTANLSNALGRTISTTDRITLNASWTAGTGMTSPSMWFALYAGPVNSTLVCANYTAAAQATITTATAYANATCSPSANVTIATGTNITLLIGSSWTGASGAANTKFVTLFWDTTASNTTLTIQSQQQVDINVSANQLSYAQGTTVNASGYLLFQNGSAVSGKNVTVSFYNSTDGLQQSRNVTTSALGFYSDVFALSGAQETGTWSVRVTGTYNASITANSSATFEVYDPAPVMHAVTVSPNPSPNGTTTTISVNATDSQPLATTFAYIYYPNGTLWQQVELFGSNPYTGNFTAPNAPLGEYQLVAWAQDTKGTWASGTAQYTPYKRLSQTLSVVIDGAFADWSMIAADESEETSNVTRLRPLLYGTTGTVNDPENAVDAAFGDTATSAALFVNSTSTDSSVGFNFTIPSSVSNATINISSTTTLDTLYDWEVYNYSSAQFVAASTSCTGNMFNTNCIMNVSTADGTLSNGTAIVNYTVTYSGMDGGQSLSDVFIEYNQVPGSADIKTVSIADNGTHAFFFMNKSGVSATDFTRVFIDSSSGGSTTSPSGTATPFAFDRYVQVNGSSCVVYNASRVATGACTAANDSSAIELSAALVDLNVSSSFNVTVETAFPGSIDFAPNKNSYIEYSVLVSTGVPSITNVTNTSTALSTIINWTTNVSADSSVALGTTMALGTTNSSTAYATTHSLALYNLTPLTTYYYNITSCTSTNCSTSGPYNFTTPVNEPISGCAALSVPGTVYVLTQNVSTINDCMVVQAHNVALDGGGYTIDGAAGRIGVNTNGYDNVSIYSITIRNNQYNVYINDSLNFYLQATITSGWSNALKIIGNSSGTVDSSTIYSGNQLTGIEVVGLPQEIYFSGLDLNVGSEATGIYAETGIIIDSSSTITVSSPDSTGVVLMGSGNSVDSLSFGGFSSITVGGDNTTISNTADANIIVQPGVNGTVFYNSPVTFTSSGSGARFTYSTDDGSINFTQRVNGSDLPLGDIIHIAHNSAEVNSSVTALNKTAEIDLYNMPMNFIQPLIFRDGVECGASCSNLTSLNANTVKFNVSGWSTYSIGEGPISVSTCSELYEAGTYVLTQDILGDVQYNCLFITADNIVLDGGGHTVSNASPAILIQANNVTIKNMRLENNTNGVDTESALSTIQNVSIISAATGITFYGQYNVTISTILFENITQRAFSGDLSNSTFTNISISNSNNTNYGSSIRNSYRNISVVDTTTGWGLTGTDSFNTFAGITINNTDIALWAESGYNNTFSNIIINNSRLGIVVDVFSMNNTFNNATIENTIENAIKISVDEVMTNNTFRNITTRGTGSGYADINSSFATDLSIIDSSFGSYRFGVAHRGLRIEKTGIGSIVFTDVNATGYNLSDDVKIEYNYVYVNSSNAGLNKSANITLYGLPTNFTNPTIMRDGVPCGSACNNFTSLNAGTVRFNVSGWSNYTIAEGESGTLSIDSVQLPGPQTPIENAWTPVSINFTASYSIGNAYIQDSSATVHVNNSWVEADGDCTAAVRNATSKDFNCTVLIHSTYTPGNYSVNVSVDSTIYQHTENTSGSFIYNVLKAISLDSSTVNITDGGSSWYGYLTVYNNGNYEFTDVNFTASDLVNGSERIGVGNITVTEENYGSDVVQLTAGTINLGNTVIYIGDVASYAFVLTLPSVPAGVYMSESNWTISVN